MFSKLNRLCVTIGNLSSLGSTSGGVGFNNQKKPMGAGSGRASPMHTGGPLGGTRMESPQHQQQQQQQQPQPGFGSAGRLLITMLFCCFFLLRVMSSGLYHTTHLL